MYKWVHCNQAYQCLIQDSKSVHHVTTYVDVDTDIDILAYYFLLKSSVFYVQQFEFNSFISWIAFYIELNSLMNFFFLLAS